jgi:hypothetical protein
MVSTADQPETLIGKGLTSEVFGRGEDRVLKLFFPWVPRIGPTGIRQHANRSCGGRSLSGRV